MCLCALKPTLSMPSCHHTAGRPCELVHSRKLACSLWKPMVT